MLLASVLRVSYVLRVATSLTQLLLVPSPRIIRPELEDLGF
jgi:hypothetical protein